MVINVSNHIFVTTVLLDVRKIEELISGGDCHRKEMIVNAV